MRRCPSAAAWCRPVWPQRFDDSKSTPLRWIASSWSHNINEWRNWVAERGDAPARTRRGAQKASPKWFYNYQSWCHDSSLNFTQGGLENGILIRLSKSSNHIPNRIHWTSLAADQEYNFLYSDKNEQRSTKMCVCNRNVKLINKILPSLNLPSCKPHEALKQQMYLHNYCRYKCLLMTVTVISFYFKNKSVLSAHRGLSTWRYRICCWAPAPAARRPQLSIDISCPQGAQQQTRPPPLLLSIDGTDRRTDAWPLHRPCSENDVGYVNKPVISSKIYGIYSKLRHLQ